MANYVCMFATLHVIFYYSNYSVRHLNLLLWMELYTQSISVLMCQRKTVISYSILLYFLYIIDFFELVMENSAPKYNSFCNILAYCNIPVNDPLYFNCPATHQINRKVRCIGSVIKCFFFN